MTQPNCLFCPCPLVVAAGNFSNCPECRTSHLFRDQKLILYYFVHNEPKHYYQAIFNCESNRFILYSENKIVLELDFLPQNITPKNYPDKLKTLLTFL